MRVFTCDSFTGHYPVGTAAIIVANNTAEGARLLNEELKARGLPGNVQLGQLNEVDVRHECVDILCDGDY